MEKADDNCWNCRTTQQKFRCKGCGFALYCSQICQKEHWKTLHVYHCKYLSGKKSLPGSAHNSDICVSCKKESLNYKDLHKKDDPFMVCHVKLKGYLENYKRFFVAIAKYNMNYETAGKDESTWNIANFPFEFGEITGDYVDYLDKLLGFLQSLLYNLLLRFPKREKIFDLSKMLLNFRAYHWSTSLKTGVTSERVAHTLEFIKNSHCENWVLELHQILGKLETQQGGFTAWNSFLFLYEMLGVSHRILPLLCMEVVSFDEEDIKHVRSYQTFSRNINNEEIRITTNPLLDQVFLFEEQLKSLTICDADFNLKPFQQIYEHFSSRFEQGDIESKQQRTPKHHPYSCELCLKDVDPKECQYVFHSIQIFDSLDEGLNGAKQTWEELRLVCESEIVADKAYITYSLGSGLRVICNKGNCKDIFFNHVAVYRIYIYSKPTNIIHKYQSKFADLQCCVCKILSGKSHRCSTCKCRLYCSPKCQNKDWNIHASICKDLKEAGTQVKIDSQERKDRGDIRAGKAFETSVKGCQCGKTDCDVVNQLKMLYGKMELNDSQVEDEVD